MTGHTLHHPHPNSTTTNDHKTIQKYKLNLIIILFSGACDVARNYLSDILEFLSDVHTLSKVKSNVKGMTVGLNEDTLGGTLKASLAQYLALEISKGKAKK